MSPFCAWKALGRRGAAAGKGCAPGQREVPGGPCSPAPCKELRHKTCRCQPRAVAPGDSQEETQLLCHFVTACPAGAARDLSPPALRLPQGNATHRACCVTQRRKITSQLTPPRGRNQAGKLRRARDSPAFTSGCSRSLAGSCRAGEPCCSSPGGCLRQEGSVLGTNSGVKIIIIIIFF